MQIFFQQAIGIHVEDNSWGNSTIHSITIQASHPESE